MEEQAKEVEETVREIEYIASDELQVGVMERYLQNPLKIPTIILHNRQIVVQIIGQLYLSALIILISAPSPRTSLSPHNS